MTTSRSGPSEEVDRADGRIDSGPQARGQPWLGEIIREVGIVQAVGLGFWRGMQQFKGQYWIEVTAHNRATRMTDGDGG